MTADKKQPMYQSPDQQTNPSQLTPLQSPLQSPCIYNIPQPSMAIMDASLNLDLSPASIPSFASLPNVSASCPQHQHQPQFIGQPSPVSHLGCMEPVNGVPVQQHACSPRTAAEKTGKTQFLAYSWSSGRQKRIIFLVVAAVNACSCQSVPLYTSPAVLLCKCALVVCLLCNLYSESLSCQLMTLCCMCPTCNCKLENSLWWLDHSLTMN